MKVEIRKMFFQETFGGKQSVACSLKNGGGNHSGEKRTASDGNHEEVFQRSLPPGDLNGMHCAIDAVDEGVKKTERAPEQDDHGNYPDASPGHFELVHCVPYEILLGIAERQEAFYRADDLLRIEERRSEGEKQGEKREQRKQNVVSERRGALLAINLNVDVRGLDDGAPRLMQAIADCAAHTDD